MQKSHASIINKFHMFAMLKRKELMKFQKEEILAFRNLMSYQKIGIRLSIPP